MHGQLDTLHCQWMSALLTVISYEISLLRIDDITPKFKKIRRIPRRVD